MATELGKKVTYTERIAHIKLLNQKVIYHKSTAQKMKFFINDFFSKCDQICSFLRVWSHLLRKSLMKNFIFCAVHKFS